MQKHSTVLTLPCSVDCQPYKAADAGLGSVYWREVDILGPQPSFSLRTLFLDDLGSCVPGDLIRMRHALPSVDLNSHPSLLSTPKSHGSGFVFARKAGRRLCTLMLEASQMGLQDGCLCGFETFARNGMDLARNTPHTLAHHPKIKPLTHDWQVVSSEGS